MLRGSLILQGSLIIQGSVTLRGSLNKTTSRFSSMLCFWVPHVAVIVSYGSASVHVTIFMSAWEVV